MNSKQRARQLTQALEATAKAVKVRFLLSPGAPLILTVWQSAQVRLQDYQTDRATAAAKRPSILWQSGEQSTFNFLHPAQQRQRPSSLTSLQDRLQANSLRDLSSPEGRVRGARY